MIISSNGGSIKIVSQSIKQNTIKKDLLGNDLLYKFIPDLNFKPKKRKIILRVENKKKININFSAKSPYIYGNYPHQFNSTDIIVVAEYLLEYLRQKEGICTIHSSSIYKKGKAILFFINLTGAGKTSLSLYLNQKYEFNLFSDEKTLVDLKRAKLKGQSKKLFVTQRVKTLLKNENMCLENALTIKKVRPKKLSFFIMPVIVAGTNKVKMYRLTPSQLRWYLYEEFSKDIRLVNGAICEFSHPLPSLDNIKLSNTRRILVNRLSQQVPAYFVLGNLKNIADSVNQIFEKTFNNSSKDVGQ